MQMEFGGSAVRASILAGLFVLGVAVPHALLAQSPDDIREGKVCATCHAEQLIVWAGKHGTKGDGRTPIANAGCATCHGDPAEHLKSFSNPMPRRFSKMGSAEKNQVCTSCHQGRTRIHWQGSTHDRNDVACATCHR